MLWLALHLPALPLEAWAATLGDQADGRPLALLHEQRVQQADAAACACGIRPGMACATALALAPDLLTGQAQPWRELQALRAVAHVALGFSPSVAWGTPPLQSPGRGVDAAHDNAHSPPQPASSPALVGVRLEVSTCLRLFGGLAALLDRLRAQLAPLGHRVRIASAPTALGAALLAAWRADMAQGPHSHSPAALQRLLDGLPLPLLLPQPAQQQALQAMGLRRLADLAPLPRAGLARRLGPMLLDDIDRACGRQPEAQRWLQLPPRFASRIELHTRADRHEQVAAGAQVLLARLLAWAGAQQARVAGFDLLLHHGRGRHHDSDHPGTDPHAVPEHSRLHIAPAQPSADAAHLQYLLAERLARSPLAAPALELSLHCQQLAPLAQHAPPNVELFLDRQHASPDGRQQGLARLIERLQARLGREQVQQLQPVADHRPERGTRWQPAEAARPLAVAQADRPALQALQGQLSAQPLWLLPQPQALAQHPADGLPRRHGRVLQLLAGPERLDTGWWDIADTAPSAPPWPMPRDYYIARDDDGALLWLFHHPQAGWVLQGLFG